MKLRNNSIDVYKSIALVAIILYHFKSIIIPFGYLGVDIFLVISGYLLIKSLLSSLEKNEFNYFSFISKKLMRLWPMVLIAALLSVAVGYYTMLPDDYENLNESVVASSLFANNILESIVTRNYWNVRSSYKPLMHLWYIGVLMQAYIVLPLIYLLLNKIVKNPIKAVFIGTITITVISLALYLSPLSYIYKFYYMPFRLFEITAGGLVVVIPNKLPKRIKEAIIIISIVLLLFMLCSRVTLVSASFMLISVVGASCAFVYSVANLQLPKRVERVIKPFAAIGQASYSIYIWHQVVIAFLFYAVFPNRDIKSFIVFILITAVLSYLSFRFIEIPLQKVGKSSKQMRKVVISCGILAIALFAFSLNIYLRAGVVRDVPELNVDKNNVHRNMHSEYVDRPYDWGDTFTDKDNIKILVMGTSYGRDWSNVLYEYDSDLEIRYFYYSNQALLDNVNNIEKADFVFYASGPEFRDIPNLVKENVPSDKLYVAGNKLYGYSNGIIYSHRFEADYFDQTIALPRSLVKQNDAMSEIYGNHYVDLIKPIEENEGYVHVFTDDNKYISQDCEHLTQSGAKYYARILDLDFLRK